MDKRSEGLDVEVLLPLLGLLPLPALVTFSTSADIFFRAADILGVLCLLSVLAANFT